MRTRLTLMGLPVAKLARTAGWVGSLLAASQFCLPGQAAVSLAAYDAAILDDAAGGLVPLARLESAVTLTGANRAAFNFGPVSGDATFEFILEGNPAAIPASGYLAVGSNTASNLRYEQYNNTGQMGFTQLGVLDYLFTPAVPSPTQATHITYLWDAAGRTMKLYVNGLAAGYRSGVTSSFAMPSGPGWLGANPNNGENMVGTIYRVTVYNDRLADEVIRRHAEAYLGIVRPPVIVQFTATPEAFFAPGSARLAWQVRDAQAVLLDGLEVTGRTNLTVAPVATTTYTLTATNAGGSVRAQVTVVVNPAPGIVRFASSRKYILPGESVTLSWTVRYASELAIVPEVGDVTGWTLDGMGSLEVQPGVSTTYTLSASNAFGWTTAQVEVRLVRPASHPVISEFMAADDSTLADEDGEFSGWIEVHNPTATAVGLAGWFLTDDADDPTRWPFPAVTLAPGGYLVVFASGKDRRVPGAPLHTNFRLHNGGEYLALVGPGPRLVHGFAPAYPPQRPDVSYGLLGGDPAVVRYLGVPTPGAANEETPPPPAPVEFSRPSGFFTEPFEVTLTAPDPGAEIRFTLDGSVPGPTNGTRYTGPLPITNTTRLRAVALAYEQVSRVAGVSYIKLATELAGYTSSLPIMVIENFGAGVIPQKGWNSTGAGLKQVPRQAAAWATFERVDGVSSFSQPPQMFSLVGIRGRGAYSTQWRQKPYSVEAMDEHGQEVEVSPLGMPAHPDWVLYFPDPDQNKDPTLLFNTFAYELSRRMGHYAVRFRWVEAFINEDGGELRLADRRGVYALIERVARGKDRLDFQRLSADGTRGGWLLNINRMDPEPETGWPAPNGAMQPWFFRTAGANRIQETAPNTFYNPVPGDDQPRQYNAFINFDNPNGYLINTNQRAAIENWFRQFEDVLYNNALWRDPVLGYRRYIDPREWADYFVLNVLTRNGDGLLLSMYPWKGDDGKLRIGPAWDYNWNAYYVSGGPTGNLMHRSDRLWYARLFADPDFLQLYIDRWWALRRGPMSNEGLDAIIDAQVADITLEKSLLNGMPSVAEWTNRIGQMKTWLKTRADWIDSNYLRPPTFNQEGGPVPDGFLVFISGTNGTIYFTTDGTDPRAPGGGVAPSAQAWESPILIHRPTLVQARIRNGTNWSGLTAATFYPPQDLSALRVTEIMYNPPAFGLWTGENLEFLELKNVGSNTLDLSALTFTAGISFTFSHGTRLGPGQFIVLVRNAEAFASKYPGVPISGVYAGRLDNAGETIRLATAWGGTVFDLTYNDRAPWPLAADGYGFSAVPLRADQPNNSNNGRHWRASARLGGSPGADDPEPAVAPVLLNEILSHTEPPAVDAVELFNPTDQAVNLSGWFLSDDGDVPRKYRIPDGTVIPAGGFLVFTEADFNADPQSLYSFALDRAGEAIYLTAADAHGQLTGYGHGVDFGAAARGVSFGRYLNSVGDEQFPAQATPTLGGPNAGPLIGPVVITEIHYHPAAAGSEFTDEFIELKNITATNVPLFDPQNPAHTWQLSGLKFEFPPGATLPPGGLALVVAIDPSQFRARYCVPEAVAIFGPFAGVLQNNGERLQVQHPDTPDAEGRVPYVTVDEVRYHDKAPWPPAADGGGPSLQRLAPTAYGNDPANWTAAVPTPGAEFVAGQPPIITAQPQSRTVLAGQAAALSVRAQGAEPLQFQWLFNDAPLAGETNAALQLPEVQPAHSGAYQVIVFNGFGSTLSDRVTLRVRVPPLIVRPPTNVAVRIWPDPLAARSTNITLSVLAYSAFPLRYQWLFNGQPIPGAAGPTLTITNVQTNHWGQYAVAVSDEVGTTVSAPAWLWPLVRPSFIIHPASQNVAPGEPVTLSAVVSGWPPPFALGWRCGATPLALSIQDSAVSFYSFQAPTVATTLQFRATVTNLATISTLASQIGRVTVLADSDGDGLPDVWELAYGLDPADPADQSADADGDGLTHRQEYLAGTDPTDPASVLKLEAFRANSEAWLAFVATSNKTYTVQFSHAPATGSWAKLADVPARTNTTTVSLTDPDFRPQRFYRLVTPRQP